MSLLVWKFQIYQVSVDYWKIDYSFLLAFLNKGRKPNRWLWLSFSFWKVCAVVSVLITQLTFDCVWQVKQGAENMIQSLTSSHSRDKKLLAAEAQQMLADSKAKIEFLKMRIMKAKQSKQQMASANGDVSNNNNNKGE